MLTQHVPSLNYTLSSSVDLLTVAWLHPCPDWHICLQDFDSTGLKHKKHWNSFTTAFFMDLATAVATLATNSCLDIDVQAAEAMLKQDLHCHICGRTIKNMPTLKSHIQLCENR